MTGRRVALVVCPLVALLLFLPTLRHDFVFDDRAVIGGNPLLAGPGDLPRLLIAPYWNVPGHERSLYRPLTSVTFLFNRALGGMDPRWFHLVNILGHAATTLLVVLLALEFLPGAPGAAAAGAAAAGLLFAVHPVHVEAVAGIVGRAEILAACGALVAVLAHRRALRAAGGRAAPWVAAAWAGLLAAVASKESALVTPALCLLAGLMPGAGAPREGTPGRRRLALWAGYAVIVTAYLAVRTGALGSPGVGMTLPFVDNPAAAAGPFAGRLTAIGAVARYARLLLWPSVLSADYSYDQIPIIRSVFEPLALGGLGLVLTSVMGGWLLLRRGSVIGFGLLWIAISAALTSNLVIFIGTLLAERLMYLPSVGLCLVAGAGVSLATRSGSGRRAGTLAVAAAITVSGAASWRTATRIPEWRDDFALYRSAARVSPRSARIRYNLGNALLRNGDAGAAAEQYRAALAIYPEFGDARVNLGMALLQQGRPGEALGLLQAAAARMPRSADAAVNLGTAWRAMGRLDRAEEEFRRALSIDPGSAKAWNDLGSLSLLRGDAVGAVEEIRRAVDLAPAEAIFRVNLADALNAAGRADEADRQFLAASKADPDLPESRRGLGEVALRAGDAAAAEPQFLAACAARQPSARACNFLGYILARRNDARAAVEQYERALRIDPGLADAHRSLGLLYAGPLDDPDRAAGHLAESLRLDPGQGGADELRAMLAKLRGRNVRRWQRDLPP